MTTANAIYDDDDDTLGAQELEVAASSSGVLVGRTGRKTIRTLSDAVDHVRQLMQSQVDAAVELSLIHI